MPETGHLRADARRNRELIIDTARTVFAEQGPGVTMDEVARQAGVGAGTLYRHFPDRDSLVRAVLVDTIERMIALAGTAREEETWAWDALSRFVHDCAGLRLDLLISVADSQPHGADAAPEINDGRIRLLQALDRIVSAAHDEGALRSDVGAGDVMGVVGLLIRGLPALPRDLGDELRERAVRLLLAGMRAHPAPVPPEKALTAEELSRRISEAH
ncbi:TetR/AcrR family transcriptional regulator [Nonomuraea sp. K274]|uniref:TetR/AcrR family transcriptional regulator n=1 Tax=Nonomuraea cypriaca TaxID=1187855 RepID=A0A931F593_9ACTN|nr:TetR/AcrR family transcriptional regulator [Nonomuraea cypriaca]MBF8191856.1 TetR/AcrR family transcriptional regulator [Nonomuraea cypriaca]